MTYLITPSLYSSYDYYVSSDFSEDEDETARNQKAKDDFIATLKKEKTEPSEAMKKGVEFENLIFAYTKGFDVTSEEFNQVKEIGDIVKGGIWQQKLYKKVGNLLLYGKADVIKQDKIYDIKRVSKYDDAGKYQSSIQHLLYMECSEIPHFEYLISDGKNVYKESYDLQRNNQEVLISKINEMLTFIKSFKDFNDPFEANWQAKD